jgi:K+-H+ exchange-related protein
MPAWSPPLSRTIINDMAMAEEHSAKLYLAEEDASTPELLFYDESVIRDSNWKKTSEKGRKIWQRLKARYEQISCEAFADDRFLRKLHKFQKITVFLNKPIDPAEVRCRLKKMLRDRSYHHLRWLIIDAALLPLSLFVMVLPGPNLFGYYLLFRVFSHWKSYQSVSRTRLEDVDVQVNDRAREVHAFLKSAHDVKTALKDLRKRYGLRALQEHQFLPQSIGSLVRLLGREAPGEVVH